MLRVKSSGKGFMLIEAVVAIGIFAAAITMRTYYNKKEKDIQSAIEFGGSLSEVPYAFDKMVLLDGVSRLDGWDREWGNTELVKNNLLSKYFIGVGHSACEGTWVPNNNSNEEVALLPCHFMSKIPFAMDASARITSSSMGEIKEFSLLFYHKDPNTFSKYFSLYPHIIKSAKLRSNPQITGEHNYDAIDKRNNKNISFVRCAEINVNCAIEVKYKNNNMGLDKGVYLRTDGQNSMKASVGFASGNSGRARCSKIDSGGNSSEVNCGLNIDAFGEKNEVTLALDKSYSSGFLLSSSYLDNGALLNINCKGEGGVSGNCGMSVVKSGVKSIANIKTNRAKLNKVESYGGVKVMSGNQEMLSVNASDGLIKTEGSVLSSGTVDASGKINSLSNISASNEVKSLRSVISENNISVVGSVFAHRNVVASNRMYINNQEKNSVLSNGDIRVGGNVLVKGVRADNGVTSSININGNILANSISSDSIIKSVGNIVTDRYFHIKGGASAGSPCGEGMSVNEKKGLVARDGEGSLLYCASGYWKEV